MARSDQLKDIVYCWVNSKEHYVISSGIEFQDFASALEQPLTNLLLLKHDYEAAEFHFQTQFNYVTSDELAGLVQADVSKFNHFCWVDFEDSFSLDQLEGQELAELLYLAHMKKQLAPPFYQELNNRFAYLSSQDGWFNRVYYRDWNDFYDVLGGILVKKLSEMKMGRSLLRFYKRKSYSTIPTSILFQISSFLTEGMVFSIQDTKSERNSLAIPFWTVGDFYNTDHMLDSFLEQKNEEPEGILRYDKKQKEWSVELALSKNEV